MDVSLPAKARILSMSNNACSKIRNHCMGTSTEISQITPIKKGLGVWANNDLAAASAEREGPPVASTLPNDLLELWFHLRLSVDVLSIRPRNNGNNCDTERDF